MFAEVGQALPHDETHQQVDAFVDGLTVKSRLPADDDDRKTENRSPHLA